jgi:hypothetical protein
VELKPRRKVITSEAVPLPRPTVQVLLSTIEALFAAKDKPTRILYQKGEDLLVETPRLVAENDDAVELNSGLLTPYQVIRQHCELDILDGRDEGVVTLCRMMESARAGGFLVSGVVTSTPDLLEEWVPRVNVGAAFGVPVYVDPETPRDVVFLCSSSRSTMIRDFERAIAFQIKET